MDSTSEIVGIAAGLVLLIMAVYLVGLLINWISGCDTTDFFGEEDDHDDNHWTNGW